MLPPIIRTLLLQTESDTIDHNSQYFFCYFQQFVS